MLGEFSSQFINIISQESDKTKEYPAFSIRRGQQAGKKIALANKEKQDIVLNIEIDQKDYVKTTADKLTIQPDHYGFIRVRFDIPENFPGDKLVTKITATDSVSGTIHSVAIFNVNIF